MGGGVGRLTRTLLAVLVGVSCVFGGAQPAVAHNSFTGSDPQDGARLKRPPAVVRLTFLARLDPRTTKITVTGPGGITAQGGAPVFDRSRVTVPFKPGPTGIYVVRYEVASGDGHPIRGDVRFTLTVGSTPVPTAPAAAATPSPTESPAAPAAAVPPPPAPTAEVRDGSPWWPWVVGAVAALAALFAGAVLLRRRARPN